ncbi:hypothetical protein FB45DRAFT_1043816 [Roridomyces roridus]|uniref:C2H2-type domain-containing protein n=1 Tax=Roridomyces roridus TaxID=1738132 RepID=A0AAD7F883_9AGAR|nr:hypothetical protein FB45DRAFT_1043816 [Roridomyces roridus]
MYYPSFASSSDLSSNPMYLEKAPALLRPTAVRIIQLDEIPAPPPQPRRLPPSSASASSCSSSASSSSSMDEDEEEGSEYCSSVDDDGEEDEELALARAVEATKMTRILAWRAQFTPLPASPTTPRMNFLIPQTIRVFLLFQLDAALEAITYIRFPRPLYPPYSSAGQSQRKRLPTTSSPRLLPPALRDATLPRVHQPSASLHLPSPSPALKLQHQQLHQRALSFSAHADTLCPACDRRFSSKRAFRVHASLGGHGDAEGAAACTAGCGILDGGVREVHVKMTAAA